MSEWIKNGDQIRVVIEGPAFGCDNGVRTDELARLFVEDEGLIIGDRDIVSVEKIEPPVTVFRPGDVVHALEDPPDEFFVLGTDGYLELPSGRYYADGPKTHEVFTSKYYEKVSLG